MVRTSSSLAVLGFCLAGLFLPAASVFAAGYRFVLPTVNATPGTSIRWTIQGEYEEAAQGFSIAARYPSADLTIERMHLEGTILEALNGQEGVDYFEKKISVADGAFTIGVLVDSKPPFDGTLIPTIGKPLDFVHLELKISAAAKGDLTIRLENGLLEPPIDNLFSINNQPVPVTELTEGVIRLPGGAGQGAAFLRGDFNMDSTLDISDPIGILSYAFFGGATAHCLVSGDANDDEVVDISDPIFLLAFLFSNGPPPPPPSGQGGGLDPTPSELGCDHPLTR
jgi:hypothetical protein